MLTHYFKGNGNLTKLPTGFSIQIVDNLETLYAVRKEWLALENRANDPLAYFQSFDWCEKWCRIFAPDALKHGGSIHIAMIRKDRELAAILPMAIENRKRMALVLRFIGEPMIQYSKVLMDPELLDQNTLRKCLEQICSNARCDAVWLDHIICGSPLHACLKHEECYASPDAYASAISLTQFENLEAYRSSLSRSSRKSWNRRRRKLEEMGKVSVQIVDGRDPHFYFLCELALQQKLVWLEKSGLPYGKLEDKRMLRMLGELGVDNGTHSGVVAFALNLDGKPVALEIGFWCHDHYYSYLGSYDWEMRAFSTGKLLMESAIGWAIDRGFSAYDLLGNPSEYKDALADKRIPLAAYAHGKTLAGSAYARIWRPRVKPSIKQSITTLPAALRQCLFTIFNRNRSKSLPGDLA